MPSAALSVRRFITPRISLPRPSHLIPSRFAWAQMTIRELKRAFVGAYNDVFRNHVFSISAGLAYFFVLSLFPLLIFLAALIAYIPVHDLFNQILDTMARFVPPDAMGAVREVVKSVLTPPRKGVLSFGLLGTLWAASGGFAALIDGLNVAYDVAETRPYWKVRLLSIGLTLVIGTLLVVGLIAILLGPQFGQWVSGRLGLAPVFAAIWPTLRWTITLVSVVFGIELLYFWAPNVKQQFRCTLPGAVIAVGVWLGASLGLGIYLRDYANFNATYGTLTGAIALMLWFFLTALAVLLGGEVNSELLKAAGERLEIKEPAPEIGVEKQGDLPPEEKEALEEKLDPDKAYDPDKAA